MQPILTVSLAWAAATDAGDRHMREGGRQAWDESDWNAACDEYERLWPLEGLALEVQP